MRYFDGTSRIEVEMSIGWAANNPELFEKKYQAFFDNFEEKFTISSRVRRGFLTLVAEIKEPQS